MTARVEMLYPLMWVFFCVLSRTAPVLTMMPPLRGSRVPMQAKALIAISLAASVTPLALSTATPMPGSVMLMAIALAGELLLGIFLGGVVLLLVTGVQMAAGVLASLASLDIAESADPTTNQSNTLLAQIFTWLTMAIFLAIGGHRELLRCCVESFEFYPAGAARPEEFWLLHTTQLLQQAAVVGLRIAAPAAAALVLANLTTALLGRTLPQLNIMAIGFNINVLGLLWVLTATVGAAGWMMQDELLVWIEHADAMFRPGG